MTMGEEDDDSSTATTSGTPSARRLATLQAKVRETSTAYEAEKKIVEGLTVEAQQREAELSNFQRVLRREAERHEHEVVCESEVVRAKVAELEHEAQMLECTVQRLRYQREEIARLESENSSLQAKIQETTKTRTELGRRHAERLHGLESDLVHLRQQLVSAFERALGSKIRVHYETAFASLDVADKEALVRHAQLREEASLQLMGMHAVARRNKLESEQLRALDAVISELREEQASRAVEAAKTRHRRDAAHSISERLVQTLRRFERERRDCVSDSIASLKSSTFFSLGDDAALTADEMTDADRTSMIRRGLWQLERKLADLETQVESTRDADQLWDRRTATLRRLASDVRADPTRLAVLLDNAVRAMAALEIDDRPSRHRADADDASTTATVSQSVAAIQLTIQTWAAQDLCGPDMHHHHHHHKPPERCAASKRRPAPSLNDALSAKTTALERADAHSSTFSLPNLTISSSDAAATADALKRHPTTKSSTPAATTKTRRHPPRFARPFPALTTNATKLHLGAPASLAAAQVKAFRSLAALHASRSAPTLQVVGAVTCARS